MLTVTGWADYIYSNNAQTNLQYKKERYHMITGSGGNQHVIFSGFKTKEPAPLFYFKC